jgi:hypothetical protein
LGYSKPTTAANTIRAAPSGFSSVGYANSAAFYVYNSHYKASQGTYPGSSIVNADRRLTLATAIRTNADALGEGAHIVYVGDHNFNDYDADEPAFGKLISVGAGQSNDPLGILARRTTTHASPMSTSRALRLWLTFGGRQ